MPPIYKKNVVTNFVYKLQKVIYIDLNSYLKRDLEDLPRLKQTYGTNRVMGIMHCLLNNLLQSNNIVGIG